MPIGSYLEALHRELRERAPRRPRTIFLGGGTPTYLAEADLEALFDVLEEATGFDPSEAEITCEANPESATPEKLRLLRRRGTNRLSLGIQSMRERVLRFFDRAHDVEGARAAVRAAREAGFENVNVDLLFGVPGQTEAEWRADLEAALDLGPDHVSLYDLMYEPGTTLRRWLDRGWIAPLPEEACAALYLAAIEIAQRRGYLRYEISNFARPGRECRHNLVYWRNEPYVGVGCGAASFVRGERFRNEPLVGQYLEAVLRGEAPLVERESLPPDRRLGESIFLGLRLAEGVDRARLATDTGLDFEVARAAPLARERGRGLVEYDGRRLRLTRLGLLLADGVAASFL
jgi:oxygen-independent coproporphyrinogen-3 oxidase